MQEEEEEEILSRILIEDHYQKTRKVCPKSGSIIVTRLDTMLEIALKVTKEEIESIMLIQWTMMSLIQTRRQTKNHMKNVSNNEVDSDKA